MVNEVVLALTQRKKNATENSRSGGSLGQGFRFSRLALSISCCFFSTPGNSAKNSRENAPFMQTSANHHSWTVQVISIRTISSSWGEFQPVVSALDSFVSGSQDHFRLLNLAEKLRACATSFRNRYFACSSVVPAISNPVPAISNPVMHAADG